MHGYASDTNVFAVQDSLTGAQFTPSHVDFINLNAKQSLLLGTNAASIGLAIAVGDMDCLETGVRPDLRLVAYDHSTRKIVSTLVQFNDVVPLYIGDTSLILQATGFGGDGVIAAEVQARITFVYNPCSTNGPSKPVSVQIAPLGYIKPMGTITSFVVPFVPDNGDLVISGDNTNFVVALNGSGTTVAPSCNVTLNETNLNFGSILVGTNSTLSVQIRNNGSAVCTVSAITLNGSTDYALTAPSLPLMLGAGASSSLSLQFAPLTATPENAVIGVTSSDPDNPNQFISVTGTGAVPAATCSLTVSASPSGFGSVQIGTNASLSVTISNAGDAVCTVDVVTLVTNSPDYAVQAPTPPFGIAAGTSQVVTVTYTPSSTNTPQATLEIGSSGSNPLNLINLGGSATLAQSVVTFAPTNSDFGAVAEGGTRSEIITISNAGITNLNITSLFITNTEFQPVSFPATPLALPPGASTNLTIDFVPTADGVTNGTLYVVSDNPVTTNTLGLTGQVVPPTSNCTINVSQTNLNFGAVAVGQTNTLVTVVSNTGLSNCAVQAVSVSGSSAFSLIAPVAPFPVDSGGAVQLAVVYAPLSVTNDTGSLVVVTDDPVNPQFTIPLSGSGVRPVLIVSANALAFGNVAIGTNSELSVIVSNASVVPAIVNSITIGSTHSEFILDPLVPTSQFTLKAGATAEVPVLFIPVLQGDDTGSLQVNSSGSIVSNQTVALTGTGLQCNLTVNQTALDFGNVALNTTNTLTLTIGNSGNSTCTVDAVTILGNGQMSFSGPTTPFIVPPGTNVQVDVQYIPVNAQTIVILGGTVRGSGKPTIVTP